MITTKDVTIPEITVSASGINRNSVQIPQLSGYTVTGFSFIGSPNADWIDQSGTMLGNNFYILYKNYFTNAITGGSKVRFTYKKND